MNLRLGGYAVIVDDGRVLLAHWAGASTHGWTLPGGGIDPGEHPEDAAVREVLEETGYVVKLAGLLGVDSHVLPAERREHRDGVPLQLVRVVYRADVVGGELTHETDGSTDEARWVPLDEVPALDRVELVDVALRMAGLLAG